MQLHRLHWLKAGPGYDFAILVILLTSVQKTFTFFISFCSFFLLFTLDTCMFNCNIFMKLSIYHILQSLKIII